MTDESQVQAVARSLPAMTPGAATMTAYWMDVINHGLSIILLSLSIAFLVWRWWVAYHKERG